jgi:hypothetical protein
VEVMAKMNGQMGNFQMANIKFYETFSTQIKYLEFGGQLICICYFSNPKAIGKK